MSQPHYVQIPKDLNDIKQKFVFNLTKRQVVSFGIGIVIGFPVFFITKSMLDLSSGIIAMGICAAPAIICGIYKKNGIYFEQQIKNMMRYFRRPRKRIYRNLTALSYIERQIECNRLRIIAEKAKRSRYVRKKKK